MPFPFAEAFKLVRDLDLQFGLVVRGAGDATTPQIINGISLAAVRHNSLLPSFDQGDIASELDSNSQVRSVLLVDGNPAPDHNRELADRLVAKGWKWVATLSDPELVGNRLLLLMRP